MRQRKKSSLRDGGSGEVPARTRCFLGGLIEWNARGEDGMEQVWAIPSDGIQGAALVQEVAGKGYESSGMPALKEG